MPTKKDIVGKGCPKDTLAERERKSHFLTFCLTR